LALDNLTKERADEIALAKEEGFAEPPKELRRTREMRKKLHVRKGTALCFMKKHVEALHEYQLASEMDSFNEEIKADCARLTCLVQCDAQKDLGDSCFRSKEYERAVQHYNKALEFNPEAVAVLLNRSACFLKMGDVSAQVRDCESALDILRVQEGSEDAAKPELNPKVAEQEKNELEGLKTKLLLRLGSGYAQLGSGQDALASLKQALEINPTDLKIAKQIKLLERQAAPS
jgi:tetratricopeptide (TPR) repeat protein